MKIEKKRKTVCCFGIMHVRDTSFHLLFYFVQLDGGQILDPCAGTAFKLFHLLVHWIKILLLFSHFLKQETVL